MNKIDCNNEAVCLMYESVLYFEGHGKLAVYPYFLGSRVDVTMWIFAKATKSLPAPKLPRFILTWKRLRRNVINKTPLNVARARRIVIGKSTPHLRVFPQRELLSRNPWYQHCYADEYFILYGIKSFLRKVNQVSDYAIGVENSQINVCGEGTRFITISSCI